MKDVILVIDDSPDIHALLRVRLASERVVLHHELTAQGGLERARQLKPDLILLDIQMPDGSGFAVCETLVKEMRDTPVIFLTGECDIETKVRAFDLGAVDYVTKPFDTVELRARVRAALRVKSYQDLLATRAQVDALTGLNNRAYFDARLEAAVTHAKRNGTNVALVMADIDHFKRLNDHHGHPFGDRVLRQVAEALSASLSVSNGAVCRYGGEEMAMILPATDLARGWRVAEGARCAIRGLEIRAVAGPVIVTASFGVADLSSCEDEITPAALLAAADRALYDAKRSGRDRVSTAVRLRLVHAA